MNTKLMECLTNPIKNKLLMAVKNRGNITAKELLTAFEEISQATMYRYLKKLVEDGLLKITEEKQVRNVKEKVYGMAIDYDAEINKMNNDTTGRVYVEQFKLFINGLVEEFDENTPKDNVEPVYDGSGFFTTPFYANYDEVKVLWHHIKELVLPYENNPAPGRQLRSMATIFTPPTQSKYEKSADENS